MDHQTARGILAAAFVRVMGRPATSAELDWMGAVANLETGYGRAGQFGALASQGLFNWGALEHVPGAGGVCPPGTRGGSDAGNARCFYVEQSDADAAASFLANLVGRNFPARAALVLHAMNEDPNHADDQQTALDVALAMQGTGHNDAYFEAPVPTYGQGLLNSIRAIRAALGQPTLQQVATGPGAPSAKRLGAGFGVLLVAGAFLGGTLLLSGRKSSPA